MGDRDDIRAFLSSRRAKITPLQVGLRAYSRNRRMPSLSRTEDAALAGHSAEFYAEHESGELSAASDRVLDALAQALRLDEAELAYLTELARTAGQPASLAAPDRPGLEWALGPECAFGP